MTVAQGGDIDSVGAGRDVNGVRPLRERLVVQVRDADEHHLHVGVARQGGAEGP